MWTTLIRSVKEEAAMATPSQQLGSRIQLFGPEETRHAIDARRGISWS